MPASVISMFVSYITFHASLFIFENLRHLSAAVIEPHLYAEGSFSQKKFYALKTDLIFP